MPRVITQSVLPRSIFKGGDADQLVEVVAEVRLLGSHVRGDSGTGRDPDRAEIARPGTCGSPQGRGTLTSGCGSNDGALVPSGSGDARDYSGAETGDGVSGESRPVEGGIRGNDGVEGPGRLSDASWRLGDVAGEESAFQPCQSAEELVRKHGGAMQEEVWPGGDDRREGMADAKEDSPGAEVRGKSPEVTGSNPVRKVRLAMTSNFPTTTLL